MPLCQPHSGGAWPGRKPSRHRSPTPCPSCCHHPAFSRPTCLPSALIPSFPHSLPTAQLPAGYTLDRMEEGDIVAKKAEPLLERFDSGSGLPMPEP